MILYVSINLTYDITPAVCAEFLYRQYPGFSGWNGWDSYWTLFLKTHAKISKEN